MSASASMEEFEALLNENLEIDTPSEGSVVKGKVTLKQLKNLLKPKNWEQMLYYLSIHIIINLPKKGCINISRKLLIL